MKFLAIKVIIIIWMARYYEVNEKKLNSYTDSLYVYKDITPNISINNNYNKVIIKGNPSNKNISLIVKLKIAICWLTARNKKTPIP